MERGTISRNFRLISSFSYNSMRLCGLARIAAFTFALAFVPIEGKSTDTQQAILESAFVNVDPYNRCQEIKCLEFPDGYLVADLIGERYYLPLTNVITKDIKPLFHLRETIVSKGLPIKRLNDDGKLLSAYLKADDWVTFLPAAHKAWEEWLTRDLPDDTSSVWWNGFIVLSVNVKHGTYGSLDRAVYFDKLDRSLEISVSDLPESMIEAEIGDYLLLRNDSLAPLRFVSKKPLIGSSHLFIKCSAFCSVRTLRNPTSEVKRTPLVGIRRASYSQKHKRECVRVDSTDKKPVCTQDWSFLDQAKPVLERVIHLLEASKQEPEK